MSLSSEVCTEPASRGAVYLEMPTTRDKQGGFVANAFTLVPVALISASAHTTAEFQRSSQEYTFPGCNKGIKINFQLMFYIVISPFVALFKRTADW